MLWLEIPAYAGSTDRPLGRPRPGADHPRIRGEHPGGGWHWYWALGSSPHTRGAPGQQSHQDRRRWIIPAYAGSTLRRSASDCPGSDHPRIRGEHQCAGIRLGERSGSSPHTRGAHPDPRRQPRHGRIIPAYAGSTRSTARPCTTARDHPRIRGEHHVSDGAGSIIVGSSPHTRGALVVFSLDPHFRRIIPAYAGSTFEEFQAFWKCAGSSPHTRGARPGAGEEADEAGIIPAYAGSTEQTERGTPDMADHPRIRGEHRAVEWVTDFDLGSSPHTRGALMGPPLKTQGLRIIPAYAGSTEIHRIRHDGLPDHPRIRGEHFANTVANIKAVGSSPHTRGALREVHRHPRGDRIIPAYAGSTLGASVIRAAK